MTSISPPPSALAAVALLVVAGCARADDASDGPVTIDPMVVLADGDHAASTYADGVLAEPDPKLRDQLLTVRVVDGQVTTASVDVTNSVTAAPEVLALTPDGGTAFVAERLAGRAPGDTRADQLRPGTTLTAVDVSDPSSPRVLASAAVAELPEALAVSPDGGSVAVVANPTEGVVLEVFDWDGTAFGTPTRTPLPEVALATNVHWHPEGRVLAVNDDRGNQVRFFQLGDDGSLQPLGTPVRVGVDPFVGRFTPDGRYYLTANWGRDLSTTVAADRLPAERSTVSVIKVDRSGAHRVVGEAESDRSSEGLAISPDGSLVATVNMRGTIFAPESPMFDEEASVSLLRLGDDGALTKMGDYPLTAVLPEGGTFDTTGEYFVATSFQGRRGEAGGSGLQVFRVHDEAGLVPVQRIALPHGVHHVAVG